MIVVNTTFRSALWADALFAMDANWWQCRPDGPRGERYLDEVKRTFSGARLCGSVGIAGVEFCRFFGHRLLNSGAASIYVASQFGAARVILLGFDCKRQGTKVHHHGDHPPGLGNAGSLEKWPEQFASVAQRVGALEVVNASRDTRLECFRRAPLEEALRMPITSIVVGGRRPAAPGAPLLVTGMLGLGDNLYQRACLRLLKRPVRLVTSWPQIYADLEHIECLRPVTRLRTQAKNAARADLKWADPIARPVDRRIGYDMRGTMLEGLARTCGVQLPELVDFSGPPVAPTWISEPYIVIRPATVRLEWLAAARNPDPRYLVEAAARARELGFRVISVADLAAGHETAVEPLPPADERYHAGELQLERLFSLVAGAAGVIGGTGWLLPAALAYRVPMLLIHGGWGLANGTQRTLDPRIDSSMIVQALPDRYCMCNDRAHACDKRISSFGGNLADFLRRAQERERQRSAAVAPRDRDRVLPREGVPV